MAEHRRGPRKQAYIFAALAGIIGWIWLLSIPANLAIIIYALFFGGSWMWLLYSVVAGGVAKWLTRGLQDNADRVLIEDHLASLGFDDDMAGDIWKRAYAQGGRRGALELRGMDDAADILNAVNIPYAV